MLLVVGHGGPDGFIQWIRASGVCSGSGVCYGFHWVGGVVRAGGDGVIFHVHDGIGGRSKVGGTFNLPHGEG